MGLRHFMGSLEGSFGGALGHEEVTRTGQPGGTWSCDVTGAGGTGFLLGCLCVLG